MNLAVFFTLMLRYSIVKGFSRIVFVHGIPSIRNEKSVESSTPICSCTLFVEYFIMNQQKRNHQQY